MKITVIDTKTGKERVMERRFAQILSKMGRVRYPVPIKRKPKAKEPVKEPETKKREYKRRDLKAED